MTPKLPPRLAKLPTMNFTSRPAPTPAAQDRVDVAYDIHSAESLVNEFEKREPRIRSSKPTA